MMTDTGRRQFLRVLQLTKEADITAGLGRRDGLAVLAEADVFDEIQDAIERAPRGSLRSTQITARRPAPDEGHG